MNPKTIAENVNAIYSLPEVALEINQLINSKDTSNTELETLIFCDPALTAQILRLANSVYFGFPKEINTVSQAISIIGRLELRNLVLATSVISTFSDISPKLVNMETFWFHSVACGVMARLFAAETNSPQKERFFIAGLLHAIGKLVLFTQYPNESAEILRFSGIGEDAEIAAERRIFGFTHAELSAELLKQWQLPASIWQPIEFKLDPLHANAPKKDACLLHVAVNIASKMEPCSCQPMDVHEIKPTYHIEAWNQLGLNPEMIRPAVAETSLQIIDILTIIKPEAVAIY
ncbi:MAG TPA: HDOD domain-containing protein [Nitrosomonas sp.]|nr:HDOD domain-containing protein [Nitrosomonas sp.]